MNKLHITKRWICMLSRKKYSSREKFQHMFVTCSILGAYLDISLYYNLIWVADYKHLISQNEIHIFAQIIWYKRSYRNMLKFRLNNVSTITNRPTLHQRISELGFRHVTIKSLSLSLFLLTTELEFRKIKRKKEWINTDFCISYRRLYLYKFLLKLYSFLG